MQQIHRPSGELAQCGGIHVDHLPQLLGFFGSDLVMVNLRDNFRARDNLKNGSFTATGDLAPERQPGICAVNVNGSHETSLGDTASSHREASKSVLSSSVRSQI